MFGRRLLLAGLCVIAVSTAQAQGEAALVPQGPHDLRLRDDSRAVMVEVNRTGKGNLVVKKGSLEAIQGIDVLEKTRWIDQVGRQDDVAVNRRSILEWQETVNGLNNDPGLDGVSLVMTTKDGETEVTAEAPRRVARTELDSQERQAEAAGLHAVLPKAAMNGKPFPFQGDALVATLLHVEQEFRDFSSNMTLVRVDYDANRAFLTGQVAFTVHVEGGGLTFALRHEADLAAEVDLTEREIVRISVKGTASASGLGDRKGAISGGLAFEAEGTSKRVTDVAKHTRKKPPFRLNNRRIFGVELDLPSYWMPVPSEGGMKKFLDSRVEEPVLIEVAHLGSDVDPSSDEFIRGFTEVAKQASADAKVKKAKLPTGPGVTFELTADDGSSVKGCVVSVDGVMLRLRVVGSPMSLKKADADYQGLIASLRKDRG